MSSEAALEAQVWIMVEAAYGRAVLSAHALERKLCTLLILRSVGETRQIKRLALGALIDRFIREFAPDEALQEELDNMLFFRNELVHRISDMVLRKALDADWRQRLAKELIEVGRFFRETDELLEPYADAWLVESGYTRDQLRSIGESVYKGIKST